VKDTLDGKRRPEPLFFRANSFDVVEYWHTNLMPNYYDLDDFQVRTPTDVLGQHIHLVKFDVTSSDGAANGFNYEDGTFSPQEVQEQIHAINENKGLYSPDASKQTKLKLKSIPFFGKGPENADDKTRPHQWEGAQATVQLWYADPLCNNTAVGGNGKFPCEFDPGVATEDRTIRTVFTHDHFSPSTHQQAGLYAGLLVEPFKSTWKMVDGTPMGTREDGGPTSWQALIMTPDKQDSYREFMVEFQDKQLAYRADSRAEKGKYFKYTGNLPSTPWGWADPDHVIKPPPGDSKAPSAPFPVLVSSVFETGTWSMNYSNEPLPYRVAPGTGGPVTGAAFDLGQVFRSVDRPDGALNIQPAMGTSISSSNHFKFPPPQPGAESFDPYTPLLRAYPGEHIQLRTLVGAHMDAHSFTIHGLNWLFEPAEKNSGYRSTQGMGISEYYDFIFDAPRTVSFGKKQKTADYLYSPSSGVAGLQDGNWGILRTYSEKQDYLDPLPSAKLPSPKRKPVPVCPKSAKLPVKFKVAAVQASQVLKAPVIYNDRGKKGNPAKKIWDWNALMYVELDDLHFPFDAKKRKLRKDVPIAPLILRANAGDCIKIELHNLLPDKGLNIGKILGKPYVDFKGKGIKLNTSKQVGLHPQLLTQDITVSNGVNVGKNPRRTARVGEPPVTYTWYAGNIEYRDDGGFKHVPVEFGSVPLSPADPLMQHIFGLLGALIIEPEGSTWEVDVNSRASATVTKPNGEAFREFVLVLQDDVSSLKLGKLIEKNGGKMPASMKEPAAPGSQAVNYRTEPLSYRFSDTKWLHRPIDRVLSNSQVLADPETPVFAASAKQAVRLRLLHPAGLADQNITLHGHVWQELPYKNDSTEIGNNPLSQWIGSRVSFVPNSSFEVVLPSAGGEAGVPGDYLYRTFVGTEFLNGIWGLMRVGAYDSDIVTVTEYSEKAIAGVNTVNPQNGQMADSVKLIFGSNQGEAEVDKMTGRWRYTGGNLAGPPVRVESTEGGVTTARVFIPDPAAAAPTPPTPATRRATDIPLIENEEFRFKPKARRVK
jgi:hypothetical protein